MTERGKSDKRKRSDVLETHKTTSADSSDGSNLYGAKHVDNQSAGHRGQGKDGDSNEYQRRKHKQHRVHYSSSNDSTSVISVEDNGGTSSSGDDTDLRTSSATVKKVKIDVHKDMNEVVMMLGLVLHSAFEFSEDILHIENCGVILADYTNAIIEILNEDVENYGESSQQSLS